MKSKDIVQGILFGLVIGACIMLFAKWHGETIGYRIDALALDVRNLSAIVEAQGAKESPGEFAWLDPRDLPEPGPEPVK